MSLFLCGIRVGVSVFPLEFEILIAIWKSEIPDITDFPDALYSLVIPVLLFGILRISDIKLGITDFIHKHGTLDIMSEYIIVSEIRYI
jgi:hypothetical protein